MQILSTSIVPGEDVVHHRMASGGRSLRSRLSAWLEKAADADAVVLSGSVSLGTRYDQLVAARVFASRYPRRPVVLADCTWEPGSRALDRVFRTERPVGVDRPARHGRRVTRLAIGRLRAPNIHCCVLSSEEGRRFPPFWGIEEANVHVTPYWASNLGALRDARDAAPAPAGAEPPAVFAGGDSLRDYRPLLEAAEAVQGTVRIATRLPVPSSLPSNVVAGPVGQDEFLRLAVQAQVAVVPLVADAQRSGGQKTYLGAMGLGQTVVVPEAPGVLDHVRPDVTGLVPPADDAGALAEAVNAAVTDADLRRRLGEAAQADVAERFSAAAYGERLYGIARGLLERA
ncbi:glycosyltransferase [Microlunatus flavus]|uniref:Glycosyl transferases group 1 n=1 Tax=Microlunatus flavus TaxID=1036181 RepID=A0A1H9H7Y3_9ACTN|nr:glycosyltransferase [Microlunatus flavus]SEQ58420.1 Glycosyl transferases group 1 [Microlunatus flavus]